MKTIRVNLDGRSYPIMVGKGLLHRSGPLLRAVGFHSAPIVVSNRLVLRLHGEALISSLRRSFGSAAVVEIPDGEKFKNHRTLEHIYDRMFRARADRYSWAIAFGGGVVGDVAGFAAATFMRGIPYVNVPSTLLAQVDSSIGGKVGINVRQGKNLIGAFHQPSAVLSDISLLNTLSERELASGLFEVVKCAAIRSRELIDYLEENMEEIRHGSPKALEHVVVEASRIKAEVVSGDEREAETRMVLNFGHTIGHALEAATAFRRFTHGEAVGWGMVAAVRFGRELGMLSAKEAHRVTSLIFLVRMLPPLRGVSFQDVWRALQRDKKSRGGMVRMILLPRLGACQIRGDIDPIQLRRFLKIFLSSEGRSGSQS